MASVVWSGDSFKDNFEIKHKLEKYLTGSCYLVSDLHFSFKYFQIFAFVLEIFS